MLSELSRAGGGGGWGGGVLMTSQRGGTARFYHLSEIFAAAVRGIHKAAEEHRGRD